MPDWRWRLSVFCVMRNPSSHDRQRLLAVVGSEQREVVVEHHGQQLDYLRHFPADRSCVADL